MVGIVEQDGQTLSPLNVGAIVLTVGLGAWIAWNALMQQPVDSASLELPPGATAKIFVDPQETPGGTITLRFDPAIEEIQKALAASGYYNGPVDGISGRRTRTAIEAFQQANGLDVTGQASPELADRIRLAQAFTQAAGITSSTAPTPSTDTVTLQVQRDLSELGYSPGSINGTIGPETREAIRAFERERGLPETGSISEPLLAELAKTTGHTASQTP